MPLPDRKVVSALFESYINIRQKEWGLSEKENDPILPSDPWHKHKLEICRDLLANVQNANNVDAWLDTIYVFAKSYEAECKSMFRKLITGESKLALTIHAAQSYMVSQLINEEVFAKTKEKLQRKIVEKESSIADDRNHGVTSEVAKKTQELNELMTRLKSLDITKDNCRSTYFPVITKVYDPKSIELKEATFDDFINNVKNGARKLSKCEKLLQTTIVTSEQKKAEVVTPAIESAKNSTTVVLQTVPGNEVAPVVTEKAPPRPSSPKPTTLSDPNVTMGIFHQAKPQKKPTMHQSSLLNMNGIYAEKPKVEENIELHVEQPKPVRRNPSRSKYKR